MMSTIHLAGSTQRFRCQGKTVELETLISEDDARPFVYLSKVREVFGVEPVHLTRSDGISLKKMRDENHDLDFYVPTRIPCSPDLIIEIECDPPPYQARHYSALPPHIKTDLPASSKSSSLSSASFAATNTPRSTLTSATRWRDSNTPIRTWSDHERESAARRAVIVKQWEQVRLMKFEVSSSTCSDPESVPTPLMFIVLPETAEALDVETNSVEEKMRLFRVHFLCLHLHSLHMVMLPEDENGNQEGLFKGYKISRPRELFERFGPHMVVCLEEFRLRTEMARIGGPVTANVSSEDTEEGSSFMGGGTIGRAGSVGRVVATGGSIGRAGSVGRAAGVHHHRRSDSLDTPLGGADLYEDGLDIATREDLLKRIEASIAFLNRLWGDVECPEHGTDDAPAELNHYLNRDEESLTGIKLKQLEDCLVKDDGSSLVNEPRLGGLQRTLTDPVNRHVTWKCPTHMPIPDHGSKLRALREVVVDLLGGELDEQLGIVKVTADSPTKAQELYDVLVGMKGPLELDFTMDWKQDFNDFDRLKTMVFGSNITSLVVGMQNHTGPFMNFRLKIFQRRHDPLFELMSHPTLRSVHFKDAPDNLYRRSYTAVSHSTPHHDYYSTLRTLRIDANFGSEDDVLKLERILMDSPNLTTLTIPVKVRDAGLVFSKILSSRMVQNQELRIQFRQAEKDQDHIWFEIVLPRLGGGGPAALENLVATFAFKNLASILKVYGSMVERLWLKNFRDAEVLALEEALENSGAGESALMELRIEYPDVSPRGRTGLARIVSMSPLRIFAIHVNHTSDGPILEAIQWKDLRELYISNRKRSNLGKPLQFLLQGLEADADVSAAAAMAMARAEEEGGDGDDNNGEDNGADGGHKWAKRLEIFEYQQPTQTFQHNHHGTGLPMDPIVQILSHFRLTELHMMPPINVSDFVKIVQGGLDFSRLGSLSVWLVDKKDEQDGVKHLVDVLPEENCGLHTVVVRNGFADSDQVDRMEARGIDLLVQE